MEFYICTLLCLASFVSIIHTQSFFFFLLYFIALYDYSFFTHSALMNPWVLQFEAIINNGVENILIHAFC